MTTDDIIGTILGILICLAVAGVILYALFSRPTPNKRTASRSTFTHGIDDTSIDGE